MSYNNNEKHNFNEEKNQIPDGNHILALYAINVESVISPLAFIAYRFLIYCPVA